MKFIQAALVRGIGPLVFMTSISILLKRQGKAYQDHHGVLVAGLIMTITAAASVIYNIESWSLTKQIGIHYLIMVLTVYPLLVWSGWFEVKGIQSLLLIFLIFNLVGLGIMAIFYLYYRFRAG